MQKHSDFLIDIDGQYSDGTYVIKAFTPGREEVEDVLKLPFTYEEIEADLQKMIGLDDSSAEELESAALKQRIDQIGHQLCEALFTPKIWRLFTKAKARENDMIRIRLKYDPKRKEHLAISRLPWELMRFKGEVRPICLDRKTPFCRFIESHRVVSQPVLPETLRVLVIVSEPKGEEYDADRLKAKIRAYPSDGPIQFTLLQSATLKAMREELTRASRDDESYHVIQYFGHGGFDPVVTESFGLLFENPAGELDWVTSEQFATAIVNDSNLQLVSLIACDSGKQVKQNRLNPFVGVAETITQLGVPAVIGMQFKVSVEGGFNFFDEFYNCVLNQDPIDVAIAEGRFSLSESGHSNYEWVTPVLYMRSKDGVLFTPPKQQVVHINTILSDIKRMDVMNADTPEDFIFIDCAYHFEGEIEKSHKVTKPENWLKIYKELNDYRIKLDHKDKHTICFTGRSRLSMWFAAGFIFRRVAGFRLSLEQFNSKKRKSEIWKDIPAASRPILEQSVLEGSDYQGPLVLSVSLTSSIKNEVRHYLKEQGLAFNQMLVMETPSDQGSAPVLRNHDDANAVVSQIHDQLKAAKSNAAIPIRKVLLFYNGPAAVACFLAARLNAFPPIQIYEFVPDQGYYPSVLLG